MIADVLEMFDLTEGKFDLHDILGLGSLGLLCILGFHLYQQRQRVIESTKTHHADLQEIQGSEIFCFNFLLEILGLGFQRKR